MIITRTPFRMSFAGGGSDIASFYRRQQGCVLSAPINQYMYVSIHPSFNRQETIVKYARTENVASPVDVEHPIVRELLKEFNVSGVEITSTADVPSGTGLSSSSAFTVGLAHSLYAFIGKYKSQEDIAAMAYRIEIDKLGQPIGKQDQYGCALGGMKFISFNPDETVDIERLVLNSKVYEKLEQNLLLFYTDIKHKANDILEEQNEQVSNDAEKFQSLVVMTAKAREMRLMLLDGDLSAFGKMLDEQWQLKKSLASQISMPQIDYYYNRAMEAGAEGGKLLGAGGGGFLLFYCDESKQIQLRSELADLVELPFSFDSGGTKVIYVGGKNWD